MLMCFSTKIIEFEKNEDTTSEDRDAVDQTNRVLAVVVGLLMMLGGPLLLLVCHKHNKVEHYDQGEFEGGRNCIWS